MHQSLMTGNRHKLSPEGICFAVITSLAALPAFAEFNSGSTGADGALNITTPGKTIFNPRAMGIDSDGDNVFNFTTIHIAAGCTLRLGADIMGSRPAAFLASGNVTINGVINLNGERGHNYDAVHKASIAGAGGYSGGIGHQSGICAATAGEGPGGGGPGLQPPNSTTGAGAGHQIQGTIFGCTSGCATPGKKYGNKYLLPLLGGSGGGGGSYGQAAGGGAGGGAILIASSGTIQLNSNSLLSARGGDPGSLNGSYGIAGGGSGGAIRLVANTVAGQGRIEAYGGSWGGSYGYIRIEAYSCTLPISNCYPPAQMATPGLPLFPSPESLPSVKIATIDGAPVPENPIGSYSQPDVTINKGDTVAVSINAKNIPIGTVITVTMNSEDEGSFSFTTSPLSGTLDNSTATARIMIPPGYSRFTCKASW